MADFNAMNDALVRCDQAALEQMVKQAVSEGIPAADILNKGLIPGMDRVGEKMENGEMFIPDVLMATQAMGACMEILNPLMTDENQGQEGSVVIGTVLGDLHDIGKNLVASTLENTGMTVHNLGVDIAPEDFVAEIKEKKARVVCLSSLLTSTLPMMRQTVDAIVEAGLRDQVKIIVGGAPVTQAFADEIGADGFARDAGSASRIVKNVVSGSLCALIR